MKTSQCVFLLLVHDPCFAAFTAAEQQEAVES
jgi:hypothetical protein